jgi:hypothetical protein
LDSMLDLDAIRMEIEDGDAITMDEGSGRGMRMGIEDVG